MDFLGSSRAVRALFRSAWACLFLVASLAQAHFVFVVPNADGSSARVFLSESLVPDLRIGAEMVAGTQLSLRGSNGQDLPLTLVDAGANFVTDLPGKGTRMVHGLTDLGLNSMGSDKPYLLLYHPKAIVGSAFDSKMTIGELAPVEIVPLGKPGAVILQILVNGKPKAKAEITIILPDGKHKKVMTDENGQTEALDQTGRYGAWARHWEEKPGERDGQKYTEVRHYATLVFDAGPSSAGAVLASN